MSYVLLLIGVSLAWIDYQGADTIRAAGSLARQELFSGRPAFWKWAGALIIIGAIGYIPEMSNIATAMLVLVMVSMLLANTSGFSQLVNKA